jgi:hypothetical protein
MLPCQCGEHFAHRHLVLGAQTALGTFKDLAHPLYADVVLGTNLGKGMGLTTNAEIEAQHTLITGRNVVQTILPNGQCLPLLQHGVWQGLWVHQRHQ